MADDGTIPEAQRVDSVPLTDLIASRHPTERSFCAISAANAVAAVRWLSTWTGYPTR